MQLPISDEMKNLLHPYLFLLKEDCEEIAETETQTYSLQMLQVGHLETIRSPSPDQISLFPLLNSNAQYLLANNDNGC